MAEKEKDVRKMTTLELIEAAKDFSFEQKLNVVQSVVQLIPREQQQPWNLSKTGWEKYQAEQARKSSSTAKVEKGPPLASAVIEAIDQVDHADAAESIQNEAIELKEPPLLDPYAKSMRYYEKNLILNKFQHMTAKLVLHRPDNALQYMIDWCKEQQIKSQSETTKIKILYDDTTRDSDDDIEPEGPKVIKRPDEEISNKFGNEQLSSSLETVDKKVAKAESNVEEGQGDQPQLPLDEHGPSANQVSSLIQSLDEQPSLDEQVSSDEQQVTIDDLQLELPITPVTPGVAEEDTLLSDEADVSVSEADEPEDTISALSSENESDTGG